MRKLVKVRVFNAGHKWSLMIPGKSFTFLGSQKKFQLFLKNIQAADCTTDPRSTRNKTYISMASDIVSGSHNEIWVWSNIIDKLPPFTRYNEEIILDQDFRINESHTIPSGSKLTIFEKCE